MICSRAESWLWMIEYVFSHLIFVYRSWLMVKGEIRVWPSMQRWSGFDPFALKTSEIKDREVISKIPVFIPVKVTGMSNPWNWTGAPEPRAIKHLHEELLMWWSVTPVIPAPESPKVPHVPVQILLLIMKALQVAKDFGGSVGRNGMWSS